MQIPLWVFLISIVVFIGILWHQNSLTRYWENKHKQVQFVLNMYVNEYGSLTVDQIKRTASKAKAMENEDEYEDE